MCYKVTDGDLFISGGIMPRRRIGSVEIKLLILSTWELMKMNDGI
jgi:hypothetical protein